MLNKLPIVVPSPLLVLFDVLCVIGLLALLGFWIWIVHHFTDNRVALITHAIFGLYLVVLLSVVFLPLHGFRSAAAGYQGTQPLARAWQWGTTVRVPWEGGHLHWQRLANATMTIPFGFGFGLLAPRVGVRRTGVACLAWAISLELTQLAISLALGIAYRTFDVNDIVDNAFGAWLGLSLFGAVALLVRHTELGANQPPTRVTGFLWQSVGAYFDAHAARRDAWRSRRDVEQDGPQPSVFR